MALYWLKFNHDSFGFYFNKGKKENSHFYKRYACGFGLPDRRETVFWVKLKQKTNIIRK